MTTKEEVEELGYQETESVVEHVPWRVAVGRVMSNRNFRIFLATAWIYSSMQVVGRYFTLYLRDIGIPYITIGLIFSTMTLVTIAGVSVSGYLADNRDRKQLAAITMAINSCGFFILAFANEVITVGIALITLASSEFTGRGGTAYIMEVIDRRHGGVAVSLFTMGTILGLGPLFVITLMFAAEWIFIDIMKTLFLATSVLYMVCAIIRIRMLDSTPIPERERSADFLRDFLGENWRGLKLLLRVFPVFMAVMFIDALSDTFYNFSNLYYVNETLAYGIVDINLMLLLTLLISVPLTLYLGQLFDKHGGRRLTIVVYSVMPVAIGLLIVAQYVPYIAPVSWIASLDTLYPGLSVVFSLAFIATAAKSINDVLWMSVINAYIQKSLPRQELGKMLGLSGLVIMMTGLFGPILSGWIYQYYQGIPLLVMAFILNIVILIVLAVKSIEPKVSVEILESELGKLD